MPTFALLLSDATEGDIERLGANVPKQEAGRMTAHECTLSRANKSVRLFEYVDGGKRNRNFEGGGSG